MENVKAEDIEQVIADLRSMAFEIVSFVQDVENVNFDSIAYKGINRFLKTCYTQIFDSRYTNKEQEIIDEFLIDYDLLMKKKILKAFSEDDLLRQFIGLLESYIREEMNTRVQIDILMRVKGSHRFGDYSNPQNKLIIENYFDDVMGVTRDDKAQNQDSNNII